MYRKVLISGVTAAAIIGAGGTALAVSGSGTTSGTPSASSSSSAPGSAHKAGKAGKSGDKHGRDTLLKHLAHGQIVTKDKDGKFVTHDLIAGTVTSVSSTSITVQAADKTSETFTVGTGTVVRQRTAGQQGKGTTSSIAKITKGAHVLVAGTGTSTYAATRILELPVK